MRIGLVAPPFICVPPKKYGGTELFVALLAEGIRRAGHEVVVYTLGESQVAVERRWLYEHCEWPLPTGQDVQLRDLTHNAWAVRDAACDCDVVHVQGAPAVAFSCLVDVPFVYTLHHSHEEPLSNFYAHFPEVQYVAISEFQRKLERMPRMETVYHGVNLSQYSMREQKQEYLAFLGRFAPVKGPHLAIQAAKRAGIPLKMAGEIQPINQDYFDAMVKPHIDGRFIEYIGEADLAMKNELLGGARAMLFPIQWNEPFGLVMIESMACGTPVIALSGGSVPEVVKDGVSGKICRDVDDLAECARTIDIPSRLVRKYCEEFFSVEKMTSGYLDIYQRLCEPDGLATVAEVEDELPKRSHQEIVSEEAAA